MAHTPLGPVLHQIRRLAAARETSGLSDRQLLQVIARDNDPNAFAAIVERHGPLVLRVCRHVLRHAQDAEDAFQATFLVLARKVRSIRKRAALASWLHGVAYRMATKAKRDAARRRNHERQAGPPATTDAAAERTWREVQAILDEEIERLPEKYRAPFVLCCLGGSGRSHAARQLGIKEGTLSSRLTCARRRLQLRLTQRGVTLAAVLAGAALATTHVSAALVQATVRASRLFASGSAGTGALSGGVAALARGGLRTMALSKVKAGLSVVLALGFLTAGTSFVIHSGYGVQGTLAAATGEIDEGSTPPADAAAPAGVFRDVTARSGIDFTYQNGEEAGHCAPLEALGGGVAVLDYDGDGLPDLFFMGGGFFAGTDKKQIRGHPCKLYQNLGNGRFRDVTRAAGLDGPAFYTHGAAVVDYDRDGWPDLLVTGWGRLALFHNESDGKGGRRFVDVARRAGLPGGLWTTGAAFADLDGDGFPDLYVCQYVNWSFDNHPWCDDGTGQRAIGPPKLFRGLPHLLFRNNGNGTFIDVTAASGINHGGSGLGVAIADLDGDGKPDIFVANDTMDNFLYRNECSPGKFRFVEIGMKAGVARDDRGTPTGSKGVALGDFDGSGWPSLFVTNFENEVHALYKNRSRAGSLQFLFDSRRAGIGAIGQAYVGWGTAFLDYDGDGCLDLFIANGHMLKSPAGKAQRRQEPVLFRNTGNGTFIDVTTEGGLYFRTGHNARGVAIVDFDNDGRLDLVISHVNEPIVILRNQAADTKHHWIGFELAGKGRRDVVGAKVVVETDTRTQTSFAHGGGSYASSSDRRHLFALGETEKVRHIHVVWPGGREQHWDGLAIDRYWRLSEGEGAEELPRGLTRVDKPLPLSPGQKGGGEGVKSSTRGKSVSEWIEDLKAKDPETRKKAAEALGKMGAVAKAAVPALLAVWKDPKDGLRQDAAKALKAIDPEAASKAGIR